MDQKRAQEVKERMKDKIRKIVFEGKKLDFS